MRPGAGPAHRTGWGIAAVALGALLWAPVLAGCGRDEQPSGEAWPAGAAWVAERPALVRVLDRAARLEGTPLGLRAAALVRALPPCGRLEGHAPAGGLAEALEAPGCADPGGPLARLHRERGGSGAVFSLALGPRAHLVGRVDAETDGDVEIALRLPEGALAGPATLLVPGSEPAGPSVLGAADRLAHARVRPDGGVDLASLVPRRGQGARLFRLRSRLFAGAVVDGTWEAAVYRPDEGDPLPPAALALGFSSRAAAVAAMEAFVRELEATWPVHRSHFAVGDSGGLCLLDLRILPGFAPCYVATPDALVIGWNPASVRRALGRVTPERLAQGGALEVDFARIARVDAALAAREGGDPRSRPLPWRRLVARGGRDGGVVRVQVRLDAGAGA